MNEHDKRQQEKRLENVLKSNLPVGAKVRAVERVGFSNPMARVMVAQLEASRTLPSYYELIGPLTRSR